MSTDNPYNELGQILAEGGEIALGLAIANGWTDSQLSALFARRFLPMRDEDREQLTGLAQAAVEAANIFNATDPQDRLNPADIPLNKWLPTERIGNNRLYWIGEFSFDAGESWFAVRGTSADITPGGEILSQIAEEATRRAGKSPAQFGVPSDEESPAPMVRMIFMERGF